MKEKSFNKLAVLITVLFIMIQFYSLAQTTYNRELLLKTWKLESMIHEDVYVGGDIMPTNEVRFIKFNKDSTYEEKAFDDLMNGTWYFNDQGQLVTQCTRINGIKYQSSEHKNFHKIKELNSDRLILIFLGWEYRIIYTYSSYSEN